MASLSVPNRSPFPLQKGQRLRANAHLKMYIPAAILEPPGTPLSEIIQLSDQAADVELKEAPQRPGTVSAIIVVMKPGDEISLGRSAEVAVDGVPEGQVAFEALG